MSEKRMKGTMYFILATVIGSFVFVAMFATGTYMVLRSATTTQVEEMKSTEELRLISATYIIEKCLKEGEYITDRSLAMHSGESILDMCRLDFGVKIRDVETEREWDFNYTESSESKKDIFVNIEYPDLGEVHVGRLYVSA